MKAFISFLFILKLDIDWLLKMKEYNLPNINVIGDVIYIKNFIKLKQFDMSDKL